MKKKYTKFEKRLIAWLRREWWMYDENRKKVLEKARLKIKHGPKVFKCAKCKEHGPKVVVDHKKPWIDPETGIPKFWYQKDKYVVDWTTLILGLRCSIKNLQVLCKNCHQRKTNAENKKRKA